MSPQTVRVWQGCLIFEYGSRTYRIPAAQILGVWAYAGATLTSDGARLPSPLVVSLAERDIELWCGSYEDALRLRVEVLSALGRYWQTGPADKPAADRPDTTKVEP